MEESLEAQEAALRAALAAAGGGAGAGAALSWGWMLGEAELAPALRFLRAALDRACLLPPRDAARYAELEEKGLLLSDDELEEEVASILEQYPGLTLPGDQTGLDRAKKQNECLKERLKLLNKQEKTLNTLKQQNELAEEELVLQISELKDHEARCRAEMETAETNCLTLAENAEQRVEELIGAVAKNLQVYNNFQPGKEIPSKFVISGPIEAYTQNKRLFKSHFKICTSRLFDGNQWKETTLHGDSNLDNIAAKRAEKRLYDGIWSYIDSVADLNAVHKKIQVVSTYQEVHPSRVLIATTECLSSVELLKQDLELVKQRIDAAALDLVQQQTLKTVSTKARAALQQRRQILDTLSGLHSAARQCVSQDALLYLALRREWQRADELLRFAGDVRDYLVGERTNVASRIEAMNAIIQEHIECEENLKSDNQLVRTLNKLYGYEDDDSSPMSLVKRMDAVRISTEDLKEEIDASFKRKEEFLETIISKSRPLVETIWDGFTKLPNSCDPTLEILFHQVQQETKSVEELLLKAVGAFTSTKDDKDLKRKLWQWFLSDPDKLRAKMTELRSKVAPSSSRSFAS